MIIPTCYSRSFFGVWASTIGFQTQIRCITFENCPNFQLKMGIFVATVASHGDWPSLVMPLFHSWVAVLGPSESFSCSLVHEKRGEAPSSQRFWEKISVPSRNPSAKHGSSNSSPVPPISEFWFVVRSSSNTEQLIPPQAREKRYTSFFWVK